MVTKTTQTSQPKPTIKLVEADKASDSAATGTPANAAAPATKETSPKGGATLRQRPNIFKDLGQATTQAARDKLELMGSVKQRLAEAYDLFKEGDDKAAEANLIADKAAFNLYQGRSGGILTKDEVSAVLGDIFGYKPVTKDGKEVPGKTPKGQGEAIRKRVVRAVSAEEYVRDGDGGTFFEGLPDDEISDVLDAVKEGQMSIWTAYEKFAEIKREHATRTDIAFDAKKIAAIVASLSNEGAADNFANNPTLVAAYGALIDVVNVIGEAVAEAA
jgi:hypothetical protein